MSRAPVFPYRGPPLHLRVYGEPVAKGSMQAAVTADGRPYVRPDNADALARWRKQIKSAAELAMIGRLPYPIHESLRVDLVFIVSRRKSYPARIVLPYTRPDIDKLARCVLDELTGPIFGDDGVVSTLTCRKRFAMHGAPPGVLVRVEHDRL